MPDDSEQPNAPTHTPFHWKAFLTVLLVGAAFWLWSTGGWQDRLKHALEAIQALGAWGPAVFILLYILATVFLIPGSALTLGAGAAFGLVHGCLYVSAGSTLGAIAAFLIGRHTARRHVVTRLGNHPRFAAMDRAVERNAGRIVLLTRLSPILPFTLLNYAFSLTRVPLRTYAVASWVGMIPGTVLYVYLGTLARTAATAAPASPWVWAFYGLGLAATVAATLLIARYSRRELQNELNQ